MSELSLGDPWPDPWQSRRARGEATVDLVKCCFDGCELPWVRTVFPFDGVAPATMHVCLEHEGVLAWLGLTMPAPWPARPREPRHWLDDPDEEGPPLEAAPAWRLVEYGLPGMAHPGKRRALLEEIHRPALGTTPAVMDGLRRDPELLADLTQRKAAGDRVLDGGVEGPVGVSPASSGLVDAPERLF